MENYYHLEHEIKDSNSTTLKIEGVIVSYKNIQHVEYTKEFPTKETIKNVVTIYHSSGKIKLEEDAAEDFLKRFQEWLDVNDTDEY